MVKTRIGLILLYMSLLFPFVITCLGKTGVDWGGVLSLVPSTGEGYFIDIKDLPSRPLLFKSLALRFWLRERFSTLSPRE